jgi:hypothetical protein
MDLQTWDNWNQMQAELGKIGAMLGGADDAETLELRSFATRLSDLLQETRPWSEQGETSLRQKVASTDQTVVSPPDEEGRHRSGGFRGDAERQ